MQIEFENLSNEYFISAYGKDFITIRDKKYYKAVVLMEKKIDILENENNLFNDEFFEKKIEEFDNKNYDFILFGTGKKIISLSSKILSSLYKKKIPHEVMNSISAFKTYNILLSQGRRTLAFLKLES